jgi:hypothetical protein
MMDLGPRAFGAALRESDLTDAEKDSLDRLYVALNMKGSGETSGSNEPDSDEPTAAGEQGEKG